MSQGSRIPLADARRLADQLRALLESSCAQIEIAGSIRREAPEVADIELVAIPRITSEPGGDLWGTPVEVDHLDLTLGLLDLGGRLRLRRVESHRADGSVTEGQRDGRSYKALEFEGFPVDLFIVRDPAQWGVILTIRTGPADWSHRLVTDCQRFLRRVQGGYLYRAGQVFPCPTERAFFSGIGQPWLEPKHRRADLVRIQP